MRNDAIACTDDVSRLNRKVEVLEQIILRLIQLFNQSADYDKIRLSHLETATHLDCSNKTVQRAINKNILKTSPSRTKISLADLICAELGIMRKTLIKVRNKIKIRTN